MQGRHFLRSCPRSGRRQALSPAVTTINAALVDDRTASVPLGIDRQDGLAVVEEAERLSDAAPAPWSEVRPLLSDEWVAEYGRKLSQDIPDSARRMESIDYAPFERRE